MKSGYPGFRVRGEIGFLGLFQRLEISHEGETQFLKFGFLGLFQRLEISCEGETQFS